MKTCLVVLKYNNENARLRNLYNMFFKISSLCASSLTMIKGNVFSENRSH